MRRIFTLLTTALFLLPACGGGGRAVANVVAALFDDPHYQVNAGPGFGEARNIVLCCEGQTVYAAWEDDRNDPGGREDVFFNVSTDGGATWLPADIRLDTDAPGAADSQNPNICCSGQRVYVVWDEKRNGQQDVYLNYSEDGGLTWQADDIRLDTDDPGSGNSHGIGICCNGLDVYVIWTDERTGRQSKALFCNRSIDGGATWLADDVRIDQGLSEDAEGPRVSCSGRNVYVAWRSDGNETIIYASTSTDGGLTWARETRLNTASDANNPRICCHGNNVYVGWTDDVGDDLYVNSSLDAGQTWQAVEQRVNTDPPDDGEIHNFAISCDGSNVYVAMDDARLGTRQVFFNRSTDGGLSWEPNDVRVDTDAASRRTPGCAATARACTSRGRTSGTPPAAGMSTSTTPWTEARPGSRTTSASTPTRPARASPATPRSAATRDTSTWPGRCAPGATST